MVQCLVGLGSNLGDSRAILDDAVAMLGKTLHLSAVSKWHSYPSIGPTADGNEDQPDFLNGVALVDSHLTPHETANVLHGLENAAGRNRVVRWSSRTLDADLLTFGDQIIDSASLQVPHPRMMSRRFVLEPACEIAPNLRHPVIGWTMAQLLRHLCNAEPYFVTVGSDWERAARITRKLATATQGSIHLLDRGGLTGSGTPRLVQSAAAKLTKLAEEVRSGSEGPWFSNFWVGEFDELVASQFDPLWNPKLALVTETVATKFAEDIARTIKRHGVKLQTPIIHLSSDEDEAWQDALGAVQGMR